MEGRVSTFQGGGEREEQEQLSHLNTFHIRKTSQLGKKSHLLGDNKERSRGKGGKLAGWELDWETDELLNNKEECLRGVAVWG